MCAVQPLETQVCFVRESFGHCLSIKCLFASYFYWPINQLIISYCKLRFETRSDTGRTLFQQSSCRVCMCVCVCVCVDCVTLSQDADRLLLFSCVFCGVCAVAPPSSSSFSAPPRVIHLLHSDLIGHWIREFCTNGFFFFFSFFENLQFKVKQFF